MSNTETATPLIVEGIDINSLKFVPVVNTQKYLINDWISAYHHSIENNDKTDPFMVLPERWLEGTKRPIRVVGYGVSSDSENYPIHVGLFGENTDEIVAVALCKKTMDDDCLVLEYYPIYKDPTVEYKYSNAKYLQVMDKPTTGVGAIVSRVNDGKTQYLLGRRVKGPISYINLLSNFGGATDIGEGIVESLLRELKEECNIVEGATIGEYLGFNETISEYSDGSHYHAYSHTFHITLKQWENVKCMEPTKVRHFGWYDESYVREHQEDLTPLCRESFNTYFEMRDICK